LPIFAFFGQGLLAKKKPLSWYERTKHPIKVVFSPKLSSSSAFTTQGLSRFKCLLHSVLMLDSLGKKEFFLNLGFNSRRDLEASYKLRESLWPTCFLTSRDGLIPERIRPTN